MVDDVNSTLTCTLTAPKLWVPAAHGERMNPSWIPDVVGEVAATDLTNRLMPFTATVLSHPHQPPTRGAFVEKKQRAEGITMKRLNFKRTLVLGAHSDDEFGCSGTIIRLLESDVEVYYAVFSTCEESVPDGWPPDTLYQELLRATECLGIQRDHLCVYHYPVRHFPEHRQEILEELVRLRNQIQPDLVLLPASVDIHQDHRVISEEGVRAFKYSTILGYELPMNNIEFRHACYVELQERHMKRKIESLMCYASQAFRNYRNEEFIRGLGCVRGVQINGAYAEAFEVIRFIIK